MSQNNTFLEQVLAFAKKPISIPAGVLVFVFLVGFGILFAKRPPRVHPDIDQETESYAVGFLLGRQINPIKTELNQALAAKGFLAGINADSDEAPAEIDKDLRMKGMSRIQNRQAMAFQKKATESAARAEEYLASIKAKPSVRELAPGILIEPIGETKAPLKTPRQLAKDAKATIVYNAKNQDGQIFDPGSESGVEVPFANLVPGLQKAVSLMPDGANWTIYLDSKVSFGGSQRPGLPANSAAVYSLKLIKLK